MPFVTAHDVAAFVGGGSVVIPTAHLPTRAEIDALGERLEVRLPDDYRAFLAHMGLPRPRR